MAIVDVDPTGAAKPEENREAFKRTKDEKPPGEAPLDTAKRFAKNLREVVEEGKRGKYPDGQSGNERAKEKKKRIFTGRK